MTNNIHQTFNWESKIKLKTTLPVSIVGVVFDKQNAKCYSPNFVICLYQNNDLSIILKVVYQMQPEEQKLKIDLNFFQTQTKLKNKLVYSLTIIINNKTNNCH